MQKVEARVPDDILKRIDEECKKHKLTISEYIRFVLIDYVSGKYLEQLKNMVINELSKQLQELLIKHYQDAYEDIYKDINSLEDKILNMENQIKNYVDNQIKNYVDNQIKNYVDNQIQKINKYIQKDTKKNIKVDIE